MTLAEINAYVRVLLAEPDATGRWADNDLATLINVAQKDVALRVDFPEGTLTQTTAPGTQEYTLPQVLRVQRVYLAGQQLIPTDIPTLEGNQIELFDSTAANYGSQWGAQASTAYPIASDTGYPVPGGLPFIVGIRPLWYLRGGNLGLVPAPVGVYPLVVSIIALPPKLANLTDFSILPDIFLPAVGWKTAELANYADKNPQMASDALQKFELELHELRGWKKGLSPNISKAPKLVTYRSFFQGPQGSGSGNG